MNTKPLSYIYLYVMFTCFTVVNLKAQELTKNKTQITLSGTVDCVDPIMGTLASVVVFNTSQGYGSLSNEDGSFLIKMGRYDTITFSTAEHKDFLYTIESDEEFKDHAINVVMITDAIWLEAVTIMGPKSLEEFKREILEMDLPQGDTKLLLPIVNKYARQLKTGEGQTNIIGPLTYLQKKFSRHYKMKQRSKN